MRWVPALLLVALLVACAARLGAQSETGSGAPTHPIVETGGSVRFETGGGTVYTKERIVFNASDGTRLVADYYDAKSEEGVLLLHQFGMDKSSWEGFARRLQREGIASVAVDLRGHGESAGDRDAFGPKEYNEMLLDAQAAAAQLQTRGKRVIAVLGASIGANTAFRYSSLEGVPAVLLSPGLDYKGIDINTVTSTAPTLIVVGKDDTYSLDSSVELDENNLLGEHELLVVPGREHGTFLLAEAGVPERILAFLKVHR